MTQPALFILDTHHQSDKTAALMQFAGTMAHELNNIFTAVSGNLALLDDPLLGDISKTETVDEVRRSAERGIELAARLQAFAGRQLLDRRLLDVVQAVEFAGRSLRQILPRTIDLEVAAMADPCMIHVDREKFHAAIAELVNNASAAMDGKGRIRIEVQRVRGGAQMSRPGQPPLPAGDHIEIAICDSGRGMAAQIAESAVDPYVTTKSSEFGAGWGLSKVAGFIRQSGGQMILRSVPGEGTRVSLYLRPADSRERAAASAQTAPVRTWR